MKWMVTVAFLAILTEFLAADDCLSRDFGHGGAVCVCNSDHCDTFKKIEKVDGSKYVKVTSCMAGLRFHREDGNFSKINSQAENVISIGTKTYQEIIGFGGAFTDATGINIESLSEDLKYKIINAYFSDDGLEYNIGRVPIGGTDFSVHPYSYCDTVNNTADPELKNFSLQAEDYKYKIPFIQKALQLRKNDLNLFASAWIAPNWMKTNPGFTAKWSFLKDDMYQPWANYFVKFLDEYKKNGIDFWGITTGNEPLTSFMPKNIPAVGWTPGGMKKWIKENLGPTLRNTSYSDIKLLTLDDQRLLLPWVIDSLFSDEDVKKYVDGIGVHWYMDFIVPPQVLDKTHDDYPDKFLLSTEGCNGFLILHVLLGSWERAEIYAHYIMEDLNHWVTGWTDWNMVLDLDGGPTFINNFVDAPIIVNATGNEFYKQPMYYAMGHFSKFIPKTSLRIESTTFNEEVPVTAFKRPDGGTAVIILNEKSVEVPATIRDSAKGDITITLIPNSITSIVYW